MKLRVFISSVQEEFAAVRRTLKTYILSDPLLGRFFDVFLFEDLPASDCRADAVYLAEVARSDLCVFLFGNRYGWQDAEGISPTHHEFNEAERSGRTRLVFIKGADDTGKEPKMRALIAQASGQLIRRRFTEGAELISALYASLVEHLMDTGILRSGPFDADICEEATFEDISPEKVGWFLRRARDARAFPLDASTDTRTVLAHLRLMRKEKITNAAVLLFAKEPQRFIYTSDIKCAHFHGTTIQKPIPFYQVYKGNLFELVDQAVNFVLSKIDLAVGTRANGPQAPVAYEIPPEVISEAIVNAIAHRDYTSTGTVQVMLFSDRLEVWNPGTLTSALKLESLREPHGSFPPNPLIAEPLYLTKYIERMGTGIPDMFEKCRDYGLPEPEIQLRDGFVTVIHRKRDIAFEKVTGEVTGVDSGVESGAESGVESGVESEMARQILEMLTKGALGKAGIARKLGKSKPTRYLNELTAKLFDQGLIERTIPDKPQSRLQKYRLTEKGLLLLGIVVPERM